jgi:hypothetical protein
MTDKATIQTIDRHIKIHNDQSIARQQAGASDAQIALAEGAISALTTLRRELTGANDWMTDADDTTDEA